jgi:aryl-alcohol dehydrogenase-like predicted oxidoreductase
MRSNEVSIAQVTLAWLPSKDVVTNILIGATKRNQLEDNLGAADFFLTKERIAELDAATPLPPVYHNWFI